MSGRYAEARARQQGARKPKAGSSAYLIYVNRRLGGLLAAIAYALRLTPTQVSVLSAISAGAGIVVIATVSPGPVVSTVVVLLLLLGYALDSADGTLARIGGGGSRSGEWLDHVLDMTKTAALHLVILIALARFTDVRDAWLLVPMAFLLTQVTVFQAMTLRDKLATTSAGTSTIQDSSSFLRSMLQVPLDHAALCIVVVLLPWPRAFVIAYTALAACSLLFGAHTLRKTFRRLGAGTAA